MKIQDIILIILFIISVALSLWYIFGSSPTIEQALLVLIITFLFKIQATTISNSVEIKSLKKKFNRLEDGFTRLAHDFKEHIRSKQKII